MRGPLYGTNRGRRSIREFWNIQEEIAKDVTETPNDLTETGIMDASRFSKNVLFTFSTAELSKTNRVRFFYALKGRGRKQGIVEDLNAIHLGPGAVLVPSRFSGTMERFLIGFNTSHQRLDMWILKDSRKMRIRRGFEKNL